MKRNNLVKIYLSELKDIEYNLFPILSPKNNTVHHIFPIRTQKRIERQYL
jgi:hypothetical protein